MKAASPAGICFIAFLAIRAVAASVEALEREVKRGP